jgi:hypothetical protein
MKFIINAAYAAILASVIFIFPGCKKAFDYIRDRVSADQTPCRIKKLTFDYNPIGLYSLHGVFDFTYNRQGNPVSIVRENIDNDYGDQEYEMHFRYNKQNQLTDYELNYNGAFGVVIWHRYSYPDKNTVVDTAFDYTGSYNDPEPPHAAEDFRVWINKLDAKGRIIKNTEIAEFGPFITNYEYDERGNQIRPGVTYDNQINLYQTNKVWMLINNDYSVNNPLTTPDQITAYNQFGLPLHFAASGYLFVYNFYQMDVEYDCSAAGSVGKY